MIGGIKGVVMPNRDPSGFTEHEAFTSTETGFALTTVAFTAHATPADGGVTVTVQVPSLAAATVDEIAPIVADDWRRTLRRRLEDAPGALPARPALEEFAVTQRDTQLEVIYQLSPGSADIAKAAAEYVEGTYVQTIIPGYEYEPPVSGLLASARASGEATDTNDDTDAGGA
jgi:hypothetical protein